MAVKSVWQHYAPTVEVLGLLEVLGGMVNESIRIGVANNVSSLRRLPQLSYNQLAQYDSPSCYKLCAISRAAGILASRKKSLRRGFPTRTPYSVRQQLVSCYDAYGNLRSRCPEANSTNKELTEPSSLPKRMSMRQWCNQSGKSSSHRRRNHPSRLRL